jgi:hypothetical protein
MLTLNKLGGINEKDEPAIKRAREVDLITMPANINGTNCYNCKWISSSKSDVSMCTQPKVRQLVNSRMCCVLWSNPEEYRPFKPLKEFGS